MSVFISGTPEQAAKLWADSPVFGEKLSPKSRRDFGGDDTVGLSLRRVGLSFDNPDYKMNEAFGVYLGKHEGDGLGSGDKPYWVVGTKNFDYSGWSGCELFVSLEVLKRRWELD